MESQAAPQESGTGTGDWEKAMDLEQHDLEALRAMRRQAQGLAAARDPLLAGAVAQLVGIIDGLIRVADPHASVPEERPPES